MISQGYYCGWSAGQPAKSVIAPQYPDTVWIPGRAAPHHRHFCLEIFQKLNLGHAKVGEERVLIWCQSLVNCMRKKSLAKSKRVPGWPLTSKILFRTMYHHALIIIKFNKSGRRIGTMYIRWRMSQGPVATGPVWQPQAWGLPKIEGNPPN